MTTKVNEELMTSCVKDLMGVLNTYQKLNLTDKREILCTLENFFSTVLINISIKSDGAIDENAYIVLDQFVEFMRSGVTRNLKRIEDGLYIFSSN